MKPAPSTVASWTLVVAAFVVAAAFYGRLPDPVPTHWNWKGVADGFTPKPWGPFVLPLVILAMCASLSILPRISPKGFRMEQFRRPFQQIIFALALFFFAIEMIALLAASGSHVSMGRAVFTVVGALFVALGNFMGKLTKNFFVGVRTPWTLASDEVWLRTHRLAGKLFVVVGIAVAVLALLGTSPVVEVVLLVVAGAIPVVYSYVVYRRLEGFNGGGSSA